MVAQKDENRSFNFSEFKHIEYSEGHKIQLDLERADHDAFRPDDRSDKCFLYAPP